MPSTLLHLVVALAAVMIVSRLVGRLFRVIGQPAVVGEVIGGILLGPSCLGALSPTLYVLLLPTSLVPMLGAVSEAGVILYMFLVGLELDFRELQGRLRQTVVVGCGSTAVPFLLGAWFATTLDPALAPVGVSRTHFVVFVGIAMSIVAFPVLARILAELDLTRTDVGMSAIGTAAVRDLIAWCALAIYSGSVRASGGQGVTVVVGTAAFLVALPLVVKPAVERLSRTPDGRSPSITRVLVAVVPLIAIVWIGRALGVHAIIAAFLVGALMPHQSALARTLRAGLSAVVRVVLLPAFFAFIGMKTYLGSVSGLGGWATTAVLIVVATAGTFAGAFVAARWAGLGPRAAATLGVLMNTRGLMELVVLNLGLELGVITPTLFAMMVVMAITTTLMTTPLVRRMV